MVCVVCVAHQRYFPAKWPEMWRAATPERAPQFLNFSFWAKHRKRGTVYTFRSTLELFKISVKSSSREPVRTELRWPRYPGGCSSSTYVKLNVQWSNAGFEVFNVTMKVFPVNWTRKKWILKKWREPKILPPQMDLATCLILLSRVLRGKSITWLLRQTRAAVADMVGPKSGVRPPIKARMQKPSLENVYACICLVLLFIACLKYYL